MRLLVALIILALLGCALLSAYQHKPFELITDAAADAGPPALLVAPCEIGPRTLPTVDPEREA